MRRILIAAMLPTLLTAFAPAPLPRAQRRGGDAVIGIEFLQGKWKVTRFDYHANGKRTKDDGIESVRVEGKVLTFYRTGDRQSSRYVLAIDGGANPATIDFSLVDQKAPMLIGVIRREGGTVRIHFVWGGKRPVDFDKLHDCYEVTLQR